MVTEGLCPVIYESVSQKTQIQVWVPQQRLVTVMLEWQDQGHPWMARAALLRSWRSSQKGPPWLHREELMELGWPFQVIWNSYYTHPHNGWSLGADYLQDKAWKGALFGQCQRGKQPETSAAHTLSSWENKRLRPKQGEDDVWA